MFFANFLDMNSWIPGEMKKEEFNGGDCSLYAIAINFMQIQFLAKILHVYFIKNFCDLNFLSVIASQL